MLFLDGDEADEARGLGRAPKEFLEASRDCETGLGDELLFLEGCLPDESPPGGSMAFLDASGAARSCEFGALSAAGPSGTAGTASGSTWCVESAVAPSTAEGLARASSSSGSGRFRLPTP